MFGMGNKDRTLGVADSRKHYDLPLQQDEGTFFLGLLIALMAFLATIALTFSFSINHVMAGWSDGLENKITIEIPAEAPNGDMRSSSDILVLQSELEKMLQAENYVRGVDIVQEETMADMIKPWIGDISEFDDIPLPGLLSVDIDPAIGGALAQIRLLVQSAAPDIMVDAHESWLADLSRLTGSLQMAILFIVSVIGLTSIAAVAGAIKSQIEINRPDVELLHLMGAHDSYITKQFLRHAAVISLTGSVIGMVAGLCLIAGLGLVFGYKADSILPEFQYQASHLLWLGALPLLICLISSFSARSTVLRVLAKMP